ncbi:MAG: lipopolysaccharide biosynthesis protein [Flavobacteriales bacterium]|jgi:O-antigen/teichoic acid export membrane protein|nr:lipopolysaccharide biosynthesis protein [Flavobacteriales bacterium]
MLRRIAATFGFRVVIALLNLLVVVLLSQWIGAEGRGQASLVLATVTIVCMVCAVVGGATLVYLVPRSNVGQLLLLSHLWSAVVCGGAYGVLRAVPLIDAWMVPHVAAIAFLSAVFSTHLTMLLGRDRVMANNLMGLVQVVVLLIGFVLMFLVAGRRDVMAYVAALYAAYGTGAVASLLLLRPGLRTGGLHGIGRLAGDAFRLGAVNMAGTVLQLVSLRVGYYLLSHRVDDAAVGVYANGVSLVESVWLISNSMAMVQYAAIANSGDDARNRRLTLSLVKLSLVMTLVALAVLAMVPSAFFTRLFGRDFSAVGDAIVVLAPGALMYTLLLVVGHYFSGTGRYHVNTLANLAGLLVTAALTWAFLPQYDMRTAGAILSASLSTTGLFVLWWFLRAPGMHLRDLLPTAADRERLRGLLARFTRADR